VLVHHADAGGQRGAGLPGGSGGRTPRCCLRRRVVAEQDRHQRRLAGAVLAQQREHFAGLQLSEMASLATSVPKRLVMP
jgi:hypothetical protein